MANRNKEGKRALSCATEGTQYGTFPAAIEKNRRTTERSWNKRDWEKTKDGALFLNTV